VLNKLKDQINQENKNQNQIFINLDLARDKIINHLLSSPVNEYFPSIEKKLEYLFQVIEAILSSK
jgi:hypothetical protein